MYRQGKELAEQELQAARRELELLRKTQQLRMTEGYELVRRDNSNIAEASITAIADLLSCFDYAKAIMQSGRSS